jgi:hypothetical protein
MKEGIFLDEEFWENILKTVEELSIDVEEYDI